MKPIDIKDKIPKELFEKLTIDKFTPPQELAIKKGLLDGKNLVVASPTASGKTLIAEIACVKNILEKGGKAIYLTPLKSLASEKYNEFKEKYPFLNIMLSIGDYDSSDPWLQKADIIVCSNEKLDSLIRHNVPWLHEINTIVIDEIHVLDQPDRGPTLEILITRLKEFCKNAQIIALSATIQNAKELAEWLNANLVKSNYRPVELEYGVYLDGKLYFEDKTIDLPEAKIPEHQIIKDTLNMKKQILIFLSSRRNAEAVAKNAKTVVERYLTKEEKEKLQKISDEILHVLESPTKQCEVLSECVKHGVAFHHAGLVGKQQRMIEEAFKQGLIKLIAATPTLCLDASVEIWDGMKNVKVSEMKHNSVWALSKDKLLQIHPKQVNILEAPKEMVELITTSGDRITLTKNHKILIKRGKKKLLIPASEVEAGDKVALAGNLRMEGMSVKWSDFLRDKKVPFDDLEPNEDVFYFIGAMLGDGYSGAELNNDKLILKGSPCIVGEDKEVFDRIKKLLNKYKIHYRERHSSYGVPELIISKSNWLREFLARCGVVKGEEKFINEKLLMAKKEFLAHLIQGLFDTDGCVEKKTLRISFSSNSFKLIHSLKRALLRYGIVTSYRKRKCGEIKIGARKYETKENFELYIQHRESILKFYQQIGFGIKRKQKELEKIVKRIKNNIVSVSCKKCGYTLPTEIFTGRNSSQKKWGKQRLKIITLLGKEKELPSSEIRRKLGFVPWKKERRLNTHFILIERKRKGKHVIWKLNSLGKWVYKNVIKGNKSIKDAIGDRCPICNAKLKKNLKGTWKKEDFEGDIYWCKLKEIHKVAPTTDKVYDIVLSNGNHDHLFVANGFIVHNSFGVNLPSHTVLVRDLKRYSPEYGSNWIPVLEVQQFFGRAGRPKFDKEGRALMIARSEIEKDEIFEKYVKGEPEEIYSKLSAEPILRMQVLGLIATGEISNKKNLLNFFSKTFFAYQYSDIKRIEVKLDKIIKLLIDYGFLIKHKDKILPTQIGKRVAELYIDPESAHLLIEKIKTKRKSEIFWLHAICSCTEMFPLLKVSPKEFNDFQKIYLDFANELDEPNPWDLNYETWINAFKTALMLFDWINEKTEARILEEYKETPGVLRNRIYIADWLLYSAYELARIMKAKELLLPLNKLRLRVKNGIKEELLNLLQLEGIGRVKARKLYRAGIKKISDIKKVPQEKLAEIIGPKTALKVKKQVEKNLNSKQTTIN